MGKLNIFKDTLSHALRYKSNMQLQQIQAIIPYLAGCSAVLCHSWEDEPWLLGFPDMMQLGFPLGTLLMASQQKAKELCLPCHCIWGGLSPPLPQVLLAPFYLSPDEMEERNSVSEV